MAPVAAAAVAVVSAITGLTGTAAVVATTIAATAVVTVAATALLTKKPSTRGARPQGSAIALDLATDAPRRLQIGQRGNAGVLTDWYIDTDGTDPNNILYMVVYLGEGPMGPITGIWSNGRKVYTGSIAHNGFADLTEFNNLVTVLYHDGRPGQTVNGTLQANAGRAATDVGTGCAYVVLRMKWDPDILQAPPRMFFETSGAKLYDRRKDGTAGGSGSHRLTDPDTWELSANPAVALDHYMLGRYISGVSEPVFGIGLDESVVPYEQFEALADLCDEDVALLAGGTQKRYEAHGFIYSDDIYKDVILDLCRTMNARPADLGGLIAIIDNEAKTSVLTLTDDHVIQGSIETYTPRKSRQDIAGGVMGTYQDPDNAYNPDDYPPYTDPAWATIDGSQLEYARLDLDFEINDIRAQRIAKAYGLKQRRAARITGNYTLEALRLEDGDWFTRDSAKFSGGKIFEVIGQPTLNTEDLSVTITAIEVDTTDSAWSSSEEQSNDTGGGSGSTPTTTSLPAANVAFEAVNYSYSTFTFVGFKFTNNNPLTNVGVEIEIALDDGAGGQEPEAIVASIPPGRTVTFTLSGIFPNTAYWLRARSFSGQKTGAWTAWTAATSDANASYGSSGTVGATIGTDVYLSDGTTVATEGDLVTDQGQAASIAGQGALATRNDVAWGSDLTGRPTELTDGRVATGLDASGAIQVAIPGTIKLSSDIMSYTGGGTFTGDLNADLTSANEAASITGQGELATSSIVEQSLIDSVAANNLPLNENPYFLDPSYTGGVPPGWNEWVNGNNLLTYGTFYNRPVVKGDASPAAIVNLGLSKYIYNLDGQARQYKARISWRRNGGTFEGSGMHITQRNSSNSNLQTTNINCATEAPVGGSVSTTHDGIQVWEKIFTVPAGTDRILFYPMWAWSGFATPTEGNGLSASLLECSITPVDETERRTQTQTDNADETGANQAASIVGQGALATQNNVDEGDIDVPDLAAITNQLGAIVGGSININSRFIVASDGTTQILSATTGARLAMNDSVLEVYDSSNTLRVRLGIW